jgi:hypothetical protein
MALRNKMRGGGTTIGALDGFNGPSSNSYSPGAQGQGQMGPANAAVSRQLSLGMSPSGLYSPHIGANIGVMQSHIPGELDPVPPSGVSYATNKSFLEPLIFVPCLNYTLHQSSDLDCKETEL